MRRVAFGCALLLVVGAACTRQQGPDPRQAAANAFAGFLSGAELEVDGQAYHIDRLYRDPDGAWILQARFRFAGVDLALPVPVVLDCRPGGPSLLLVRDYRVLGFGPYQAQLLFSGRRWTGLWSGPGEQGGTMGGTVLRPTGDG